MAREWLRNNILEDNQTVFYNSMIVDEEKGVVYFQELSRSGINVFKSPIFSGMKRYFVNSDGNLVIDTLQKYDTYTTGTHSIMDKKGNNIESNSFSYDSSGSFNGGTTILGNSYQDSKKVSKEFNDYKKIVKMVTPDPLAYR